MVTKNDLKALWGGEQKYCEDTAPAHSGLNDVHEAMEGELCNAIYDTILKEQYKTIVEVGRHYGCTTAWILLALQERNAGSLVSIDIQEWDRKVWREVGLMEDCLTLRDWPFLQVGDTRIHWYLEKKYVKTLPKKIDFVVIDAAHSHNETLGLLKVFAPLVTKGGQIALHDSFLYRGGVGKPATEFFYSKENEDNWSTIDIPIGCGMFVAKRI